MIKNPDNRNSNVAPILMMGGIQVKAGTHIARIFKSRATGEEHSSGTETRLASSTKYAPPKLPNP